MLVVPDIQNHKWGLDSGLPNSLMPRCDYREVKSQGREKKPSVKFSDSQPSDKGLRLYNHFLGLSPHSPLLYPYL